MNKRGAFTTIIALCLCGAAWAAAIPTVVSLDCRHLSGRKTRLNWQRPSGVTGTVEYDVYRDGVKIGTSISGQQDPETNGQIWWDSYGWNYFCDMEAWPGKTHTYSVVARTAGGQSEAVTKSFDVPLPTLWNYNATSYGGRKVRLTWGGITGTNFNVRYDVYHGDTKIASFAGETNGNGENGDSWIYSAGYQYYDNLTGIPGATNTYKVVAHLFDGCDVSAEKSLAIPLPAAPKFSATSMGGRKVRLVWGAIREHGLTPSYELRRDGGLVFSGKYGDEGADGNGDYWDSTGDGAIRFFDLHGVPGKTHEYRLKIKLMENVEFEITTSITIPIPATPKITATFMDGRKVRVVWGAIMEDGLNPDYELRRDGELVFSGKYGAEGSADNGDYWDSTSNWALRFFDMHAMPGRVNEYHLKIKLMEGVTIETTATIAVPPLQEPVLNVFYTRGREIWLSWNAVHGSGLDPVNELYRDGELLFSGKLGANGQAANGDKWDTANTWYFRYFDRNAIPGKAHEYRLVTKVFDGFEMETSQVVTLPGPVAPTNVKIVPKGLNALVVSWDSVNTQSLFNTELDIYRDDVLVATLPAHSNGNLPFSYIDSGVDALNATPTYRLRTRFFPGCESGLSEPSTYAFPIPAAPEIRFATGESNSVTVYWLKVNSYELPYRFEVYRDGSKIGETIDYLYYVDATLQPGQLHHYAVRTALADRTFSELSTIVSMSSKLATGTVAKVVSPRTSLINPAWVEGNSAAAKTPIRFRVDGGPELSATYTAPLEWHLDSASAGSPAGIPLNPDTPTVVDLVFGEGANTATVRESLSWTPLDIASRAESPWPIRIRRGDSLLLTVGGTGNVSIDADGDGSADWQGQAGQKHIRRFDQAGVFEVTALRDGQPAGKVEVTVVNVDVDRSKMWIDTQYSTKRLASVIPVETLPNLGVAVGGEKGYLRLASSQATSSGLNYTVESRWHDAGAAFLRLAPPRGPVLASHPVEAIEPVLTTSAYFPVITRLSSGEFLLGATLRMLPLRPEAVLTASVSGYGTIFTDNGLTSIDVAGSDMNDNGFVNLYLLAPPSFNPNTASLRFSITLKDAGR